MTKAPGFNEQRMHAGSRQQRRSGWVLLGRFVLLGILAGLWGGTVATVLQLLVWWAEGAPVLEQLLRDTRAAAALLLGTRVLSSSGGWELPVLAAASALHLFLCAVYGWLLGALLRHVGSRAPLLAGSVFGAMLFAVNMFGFTAVFPWFAANRDWATFIAHLGFGFETARLWCLMNRRF